MPTNKSQYAKPELAKTAGVKVFLVYWKELENCCPELDPALVIEVAAHLAAVETGVMMSFNLGRAQGPDEVLRHLRRMDSRQ